MMAKQYMMQRVISYLDSIPAEVEEFTLEEVIYFLNSVAMASIPECCRETYEELKQHLVDLRDWIPDDKERFDPEDDDFIRQAEEFHSIIQNYIVHLRDVLTQA